eukprot:3558986-Pyramimonas_sp.AAC.1
MAWRSHDVCGGRAVLRGISSVRGSHAACLADAAGAGASLAAPVVELLMRCEGGVALPVVSLARGM